MKNLGRNKKLREGIPTLVLIIPYGVLFCRNVDRVREMARKGKEGGQQQREA